MISAFFMTDDPTALNDLERIYRLLQSDIFLKGLGFKASEVPPPDDFPIITDIVLADSMIRLQDIWDTPEPWPYQYFPGVVDGEAHRIQHAHYIGEENREEILESLMKLDKKIVRYLLDKIELSYDRNRIVEFVMQNNKGDYRKNKYVEDVIRDIIEYNTQAYLSMFIETALLGGMNRSPIFTRMLEAFETGGIPCGWLGPLLPEDGGDPVKAIALLHFGKQAEE